MRLALIVLLPVVLMAQNTVIVIPPKGIDPSIPMRAGQGVTPIDMGLYVKARNQALQNKLLQQQAEYLKAQQEAQANADTNYKTGYAEGSKDGYQAGLQAAFKEFEALLPELRTITLAGMVKGVLTGTNQDELSQIITDLGPLVQQNPEDYLNKAYLVLYRYRLGEIKPKPVVVQSEKPKKKKP